MTAVIAGTRRASVERRLLCYRSRSVRYPALMSRSLGGDPALPQLPGTQSPVTPCPYGPRDHPDPARSCRSLASVSFVHTVIRKLILRILRAHFET